MTSEWCLIFHFVPLFSETTWPINLPINRDLHINNKLYCLFAWRPACCLCWNREIIHPGQEIVHQVHFDILWLIIVLVICINRYTIQGRFYLSSFRKCNKTLLTDINTVNTLLVRNSLLLSGIISMTELLVRTPCRVCVIWKLDFNGNCPQRNVILWQQQEINRR